MSLRAVLIISILFVLIGVSVTSAQTVSISDPNLRAAIEGALSKAAGSTITMAEMGSLIELRAPNANITDLTGLETAVNLQRVYLGREYVSAEGRFINNNTISDLTPLSGLTQLTLLDLNGNAISAVTALSGLTNLVVLWLGGNVITDLSALSGLTNLVVLGLWDNNISDLSPLVTNRGLGTGEDINVSENPLSETAINVHIPALRDRGVEVHFSNLKPALIKYVLSMPRGLSLIHIPLEVITVDGVTQPIESVGDLYDALGGSGAVNFIVIHDPGIGLWFGYFGDADRGTSPDRVLTDSMGILVSMLAPVTVVFNGSPLVPEGRSTLPFHPGLNVVGLPLRDSRLNRVSDLLRFDGLFGNAQVVILNEGGEFKQVSRVDDPGDIAITGGQAFIVIVAQSVTVAISGEGWYNTGQ